MDSTICNTGESMLVIMDTLGKSALVPMFKATEKPVVTRNSPTSITEEHITSKTTKSMATPMARMRGRSVGMRELPSANMVPNSCMRSSRAGSSSCMTSSPCFMG